MAVTAKIYSNFIYHVLRGDTSFAGWTSASLKCMLCTTAYEPSQGTHAFKDSVSNEIANGQGYTTGGVTLGDKSVSHQSPTTVCSAGDAQWTNATIAAKVAVLYDASGTADSNRLLVGYVDFGDTQSSSSGTFTVQWSTGGILRITCQ